MAVKVAAGINTTNWNKNKKDRWNPQARKEKTVSEKVLIFGKDAWPYTRAARAAYAERKKEVEYFNVVSDPKQLDKMLKHSKGERQVPVIVEGGSVTIGFDGGTWGV
jgi:glutaredoxin 3